ncbi:hypothetical protein CRENPOLYSF1_80003 [Crenothrix polyspora]|uniref:Uncharacterized protein n=1 Tax=Crenothrix polyspora TaxID=360316 RepID=A0A1R4HHX4_9GAMM|nr:hypothetical protein CRENPOLYSF1_80003 [Crenothrix polyspora]
MSKYKTLIRLEIYLSVYNTGKNIIFYTRGDSACTDSKTEADAESACTK